MRMDLANIARLAAVAAVGVGIMWSLQALGFGPAWVIAAAAGAGATTGAVFIGTSLRDAEAPAGLQSVELA